MKDDLSLDYAMMINEAKNMTVLPEELRNYVVKGLEYCQDVTVCRQERSDYDGGIM